MSNEQSPFVAQTLTPQAVGTGRTEGIYQLNAASTAPTVIVGRDANGRPIEETRPPCYSRRFVHPDGSINWVPLRTGAVYSKDPMAERYEQLEVRRMIEEGWIPLEVCPYTFEFSHITGGHPLAMPPEGEKNCGGDKTALDPNRIAHGCEHLQKIIKARRAEAQAKYKAESQMMKNFTRDEVATMMAGLGDTLAEAIHANTGDHNVSALKDRKRSLAQDNLTK